uniref:CCHC-type domain-containing protein n=1 Tax=Tanacetum cinerariifolium TaxID=118510 RepID=A0A6L2LZM5_TANCI|nr:hypothetical protein [Tanacetum cinerariifolium]
MTSLADKAILSGADNRPPMLEKDMYDSWKSITELYMLNRQHGRMILESVEKDPLLWPTVEGNGVTRTKKYSELSSTEAIQADCDVKATNIILQGLPPEVYALRECKLYDEFDKFAYRKGESLRDFYLRFSLLLNDMNIYNMKLEQFQVNTKFLNTLPPGWSKFVTDVKLVRDLYTTNVDQLHAYLGQHEYHANKVRIMHECTLDPLALVVNHQMNKSPYQPHQQSYHQHQFQPQVSTFQSSQYGTLYHSSQYASQAPSSTPLSITYLTNDFQSSVNHNVYNPSSSIPQVEYAPTVDQQSDFSQHNTGLVVPVFQKGDDPIDFINHMMSFLTAVVTSRYPPTNNQLRTSSNPRQQATINNGRVTIQPIQGRQNFMTHGMSRQYTSGPSGTSRKQRVIVCYNCKGECHMSKQCTKPKRKRDEAWFKDKNSSSSAQQDDLILYVIEQLKTQVLNYTKINQDNKNVNEFLTAKLERYKDHVKILKEQNNVDKASKSCAQSLEIDNLKHILSEHLKENESLEQKVTLLKNNFQKEESRNIDRELALEKQVKELNNIVFKRNQSAQTVHMLTKPQFFYDHSTRQALGFQNTCYLERAQQLEPKLYDGSVIQKTDAIVIRDYVETLMLEDESHYAVINQLSKDFETRFIPQTELSTEQAFWSQYLVNSEEPNLSSSTTIVEVPKELPKVSMVNSSLKKLKFHLASFDVVVKERTNATTITEGTWGFKHTKACFRDEIISFVKALKELFKLFDQFLIDELTEVQNVFNQMEQAVEQHCVDKNKFQDKMNDVLKENERLLEQAISVDIVNIVVHANVNSDCKTVNECERCVTIMTELQRDFIKKECYDKLFKQYTTLEKHYISLEVDNQLKQELFQRNNSFSQQSAPTFDQLFEINDLKAQSQEKDTVIMKLKERIKSLSGNVKEENIKRELEEIETINIELDHMVTKLVVENEHLKQTYKQLYDSIKSSRFRSKEQCDNLIKQVNIKSAENSDLNASLQEKVLVITALKETLSKLIGKAVINEAVTLHPIDPELLKIDVAPLAPKLRNNKTTHNDYLKHTQEETATLREIIKMRDCLIHSILP